MGVTVGESTGETVGVGVALGVGAGLFVGARDADAMGSGVAGAAVGGAIGTETSGWSVSTALGCGVVRVAAGDTTFRSGSIDGVTDGAGVPVAPSTAPAATGLGVAAVAAIPAVPDAGARSIDCTSRTPVATTRTTAARIRACTRSWNGPDGVDDGVANAGTAR